MISRSPSILSISTTALVMTMVVIPAVTHADTFKRILKLGMSGPDVSALQAFLAQDKTVYPQGLVTGYFGRLTAVAVTNFQNQHHLPPVGQAGPLTLKTINNLQTTTAVAPTYLPPVTIVNNPPPTRPLVSPPTSPTTTNTIVTSTTKTLPAVVTDTKNNATTTTLVVSLVPLLAGGNTKAGASVPISYLQVTNVGKGTALVSGFTVKQNGSAMGQSIVGLTIIDDKGGSEGSASDTKDSPLFKNGTGFVPTNATFTPGQMRLFTIKAVLAKDIPSEIGKKLMIDVASIETTASVKGSFPIRGTTWSITN